MPDIGPLELILILVVALLVIGPGKLPEVGSALGKSIREFRKATSEVQDSIRVDVTGTPPTQPQQAAPPVQQAAAAPPVQQAAAAPTQPPAAPPQQPAANAEQGVPPSGTTPTV